MARRYRGLERRNRHHRLRKLKKLIVLDSSFLIAYHNTRDAHHAAAARAMVHLAAGQWGQSLLPEYVFLEVVTVLRARRSVEVATLVGNTLLEAADITFVPCSDVFVEAFEIFRDQGKSELSFADASIVAISRCEKAKFIATFDKDFRGLKGLSLVPEH